MSPSNPPSTTGGVELTTLPKTATLTEISAAIDEVGAVSVADLVDADLAELPRYDLAPPTDLPAERSSSTRHPSRTTSALLIPLQIFLAAGWARAGVEKLIDPTWWSGTHIQQFLAEQRPVMLPWFRVFADYFVDPLAAMVAWLVVAAQLAIAVLLISNRHVRPGLWAGITLNLTFTMAGRVNPSAFYLVMQLVLLFALSRPVSTRIAVQRSIFWLMPAAIVFPFARTLHPAQVIDDPALMLSFVAVLAAVTTIALSVDAGRLSDFAHERVQQASRRLRERFSIRRDDRRQTSPHPSPAPAWPERATTPQPQPPSNRRRRFRRKEPLK